MSSGVPYETLKDDSASAATEVPAYADAVVIGGGIVGIIFWVFFASHKNATFILAFISIKSLIH